MTRHGYTRRSNCANSVSSALARRRLGPRGKAEEVVAALARRIEEIGEELGLDDGEREDLAAAAEVVARWLVVRGETGSPLDTSVHCDEEDLYIRAAIRSPATEIALAEQVARLAPLLYSGTDSFQIAIQDSVLIAVLQRSLRPPPTQGELAPPAGVVTRPRPVHRSHP